VVGIVAALSVIAILIALRIDASAAPGTLYDGDSATARATQRLHHEFGDEPIDVLIRNRIGGCPGGRNCRLTDLLLTPDLIRVLSFEGCVSGNIPRRAKPPAPVCEQFTRKKPFQAISGPGTFINESARQISARIKAEQSRGATVARRAAEAARKIATARGLSEAEKRKLEQQARALAQLNALQPALRYGLSPRGAGIGDPSFVHQLVFEPSISFDAPKTRFAQFFPSRRSAVIELHPRPDLGAAGRREAIGLVRKAVTSPSFQLKSSRYLITGEPVVAAGVASGISDSLLVLLVATLVILAVTLAIVFRSARRLLPLVPAFVTVALTFGLMSLFGITLTLASIAVLPVLAGIAVANALQFQRSGEVPLAAAAATALAFLALALSPTPMARTFGVSVAVGIGLSLLVTLTLGSALLHGDLRMRISLGRTRLAGSLSRLVRLPGRGARFIGSAIDRGKRVLPKTVAKRGFAWLLAAAVRRPGRVLAIAAVFALVGWVLAPRLDVVSELVPLAPKHTKEVKDFDKLAEEGGVDRGLSVLVTARDLADPRALSWMVNYQKKVSARHGYSEERPCRQAELCPAVSLVDLFGAGRIRNRAEAKALLDGLPSYFTESVISRDRRTANVSFLIRRMAPDRQRKVIDDMRSSLDPPAGVHAELAGLPALAADTGSKLESNGRLLAVLVLLALFVALVVWGLRPLGAFGARIGTATVSLIPVALATGWSFLVLVVLGTTLNPLSAGLGALSVGLSGCAAIALSGYYREARATGAAAQTAIAQSYERGARLRAIAALAVAGFGILVVSDVPMLREFGAVAMVDLVVLLAAVALVLPAVVVWAEERGPSKLPRSRAEWAAAGRAAVIQARAGVTSARRALRRLPAALRAFPRQVRRLPRLIGRVRRSRPLRRRDEAQRP
jgi:predicted RND superfamily exporter protein